MSIRSMVKLEQNHFIFFGFIILAIKFWGRILKEVVHPNSILACCRQKKFSQNKRSLPFPPKKMTFYIKSTSKILEKFKKLWKRHFFAIIHTAAKFTNFFFKGCRPCSVILIFFLLFFSTTLCWSKFSGWWRMSFVYVKESKRLWKPLFKLLGWIKW
jgi:hypothetical protein